MYIYYDFKCSKGKCTNSKSTRKVVKLQVRVRQSFSLPIQMMNSIHKDIHYLRTSPVTSSAGNPGESMSYIMFVGMVT